MFRCFFSIFYISGLKPPIYIQMDLRPKYKGFFKIQNILPVPILGRLSRPVEIGGELNLAAKEAIFGGGSIMSWK